MRSRVLLLSTLLAALTLSAEPEALIIRSATITFDMTTDPGDVLDGPDFDVTVRGPINDGSGCDTVVMIMVDGTGTPTDADSFCLSLTTGQGGSDGDYGSIETLYVPTVGPVTYALYDIDAADIAALSGLGDNNVAYINYVINNGICVTERFHPLPGRANGTPFSLCRKPVLVTGAGPGGAPHVTGTQAPGLPGSSFFAYGAAFSGGVRVALGDVTGDGVPDVITAPGPGGSPEIRVFHGRTGVTTMSFMAYGAAFSGGVFVAAGDVNGDGRSDIITVPGAGGGPNVKIFNGATGALMLSFMAYGPAFTGGVFVAAGDVDGDGRADVIAAPGAGGGPNVKVFSGQTGTLLQTFFAYDATFTGGVRVGAGDIDGDGRADVVTSPGPGGGPHIKVFSSANGAEIRGFFAYAATFTGGVYVAGGDVTGDGVDDIITGAGAGAPSHVKVFDGLTGLEVRSFFAYNPAFTGGVFVAGAGQ
jgi:hypothetical protein